VEEIEIYFRLLAIAESRDNFLEKEMLDSDVRDLSERTSFHEKLIVLSSGSIAVAMSFVVASFQKDSALGNIHYNVCLFGTAIALLFLALIQSVFHNFLGSQVSEWLALQIEYKYKAANELLKWRQDLRNTGQLQPGHGTAAMQNILKFEAESSHWLDRRNKRREIYKWLGFGAIYALIAAYAIVFSQIIGVISSVR
jgi:hypothetical protein